eukprot:Skav222838  [mRNA]  locus=scaffold1338:156570:158078:- [translate_table: standard]
MEVIDDEVLRVTPARRCFEQRGIAFHGSEVSEEFYEKSYQSRKIESFWCHSLGGARWKKIITLMILHNGRENLVGAFVAFLVILAAGSFLTHTWVRWCICLCGLCFVSLVHVSAMASKWPEISVLDQICIKQQDNGMRANTILSLAGIMKRSDQILILWDPTWTESLWCLVELAAFWKSRNYPDNELTVLPIFRGHAFITVFLATFAAFPMVLPVEPAPIETRTILLPPFSNLILSLAFLLCALIAAYAGVSALRSYFRGVESMQQQLSSISFDDTRCYCCDRNHVSLSGKPMLCDRKVFAHCIIHWFGGREVFEEILRSEVRKRMAIDLKENVLGPFGARVATGPLWVGCVALGLIDIMIPALKHLPEKEMQNAGNDCVSRIILSSGIWLLFPEFMHLVNCVCKYSHTRPYRHCLEFAKNAAIVLGLGIPILGLMACIVWINNHTGFSANWERSLVFVGCLVVFAIFSKFAPRLINRIAEPEVTDGEASELSFRSSEQPDC